MAKKKSPFAGKDPASNGAQAYLRRVLQSWGIGGLFGEAKKLLLEGHDATTVTILLEQTDEYKKRFAANDDRRKRGLPVLAPAEYVELERQYKQVLRSYGLPKGFYDNQKDLQKFIINDMSPAELQERAQIAQENWLNGDKETRQVWKQYYGLSDGDAIAAILDPGISNPALKNRINTAQIGAAAKQHGLKLEKDRAARFNALGVAAEDAYNAYADISTNLDQQKAIAQRNNVQWSQADAEDAQILGLASARRKQQRAYGREEAGFRGSGAAQQQSLSGGSGGSY